MRKFNYHNAALKKTPNGKPRKPHIYKKAGKASTRACKVSQPTVHFADLVCKAVIEFFLGREDIAKWYTEKFPMKYGLYGREKCHWIIYWSLWHNHSNVDYFTLIIFMKQSLYRFHDEFQQGCWAFLKAREAECETSDNSITSAAVSMCRKAASAPTATICNQRVEISEKELKKREVQIKEYLGLVNSALIEADASSPEKPIECHEFLG